MKTVFQSKMKTATLFCSICLSLLLGSRAAAQNFSLLPSTNVLKATDDLLVNVKLGAGYTTRRIAFSTLASSSNSYTGSFVGNGAALTNLPAVTNTTYSTNYNSVDTGFEEKSSWNAVKNWRAFQGLRGYGSNVQFAVSIISDSYASQDKWPSYFGNALRKIYGDAGLGFLQARWGSYNAQPRTPTLAGTWTGYDSFDEPLFSYIQTSAGNAAVTWNNVPMSTFSIVYLGYTNGGTINICTNGGVLATVNTVAASNRLMATNFTVPFMNYASLTVSNLTGTNTIFGADIRNTNAGVRIYNHGHSGAAALSWNTNAQFGDASLIARLMTNENPGLVIVALGANDAMRYGAGGLAGLATNLNGIVSKVRTAVPNSDLVLFSPTWISNDVNAVTFDQIQPVVRGVASSNLCGYLSLYDRLPTLTNNYFTYQSLHFDTYHYTDAGYRVYADEVSRYFLGADIRTAVAQTVPVWSYVANWKSIYHDSGLVETDHNYYWPEGGVRAPAYVTNGSSPPMVLMAPTGLGFSNLLVRFDLYGLAGATNMSMSIQCACEGYDTAGGVIGNTAWADITGLTNRQTKTAWITNSWGNDTAARSIYLRFLDAARSGNLTNSVGISRVTFSGY